uniref:hypothetical protein n=1 Tax=Xanthomonas oryzae TaxID=347 RepID=UPI003D9FE313
MDLRAATLGNAGGQIQQAGPGLLQIAAQAIDGNGGRCQQWRTDAHRRTHRPDRRHTAAQQVQIQAETLTTRLAA